MTPHTAEEPKKRTITLTGRPPVIIVESDWPIFAEASDDSYAGNDGGRHEEARQRGELDVYSLRVREHIDGRAIVYAICNGATAWTGTEDRRGGELLAPGDDRAAAIRRVGEDCGIPDGTIRDCIADLPAEELT